MGHKFLCQFIHDYSDMSLKVHSRKCQQDAEPLQLEAQKLLWMPLLKGYPIYTIHAKRQVKTKIICSFEVPDRSIL